MSFTFTYSDVEEHASKEDLHLVIHDSVYDVSRFLKEHPGGEDVMIDVAGKNATEAFEDVGHSDEAREILSHLRIGSIKVEHTAAKEDVAPRIGEFREPAAVPARSIFAYVVFCTATVALAVAYLSSQYIDDRDE